jgi:hypothetical protein
MRRSILFLLPAIFLFCFAQAQPQAVEGFVPLVKGDKRSAMIEVPYSEDVVRKAFEDHMAKNGVKPEKFKDFQLYRGVKLHDFDTEVHDVYVKVDRKSRKEKSHSTVHLVVGRPSENMGLRSAEYRHKMEESKNFLTAMVPNIEAQHLEADIRRQQEVVQKAEKKLKSLQDDQREYEEKIKEYQQRLEKNRVEQEAQLAEIARQKSIQVAMEARRKPM